MIANYGYMDASGEYFIAVDTDKCEICKDKPCIEKCPKDILEKFLDDFDKEIMMVKKVAVNSLKYICSDCKPLKDRQELPCVTACQFYAIKHSW